jgi:protein-S-isoprenylcysteine O-methyltransferase Ste14
MEDHDREAGVARGGARGLLVETIGLALVSIFLPILVHLAFDLRWHLLPLLPRYVDWLPLGAAVMLSGAVVQLLGISCVAPAGARHSAHVPDRLVRVGPYAYLRSPIYLGTVMIAAGVALYVGSLAALGYAAMLWAAIHLVLVKIEEPRLRSKFGTECEEYERRVNRWLPWRPRR